jgi:hypothetical protein
MVNKTYKKNKKQHNKLTVKRKINKDNNKFYFLIKSNGLLGISDLTTDSGYYIKNNLLKRGNWEEFNIKKPQVRNPDFIYTHGKDLYDRSLFKYHAKIKYNIEGFKNLLNKYDFIEELKKINHGVKKKYILNQYYVNFYDYKNDNDISSTKTIDYFKSIFNKNKILIFKALYSVKGKDTYVFDNFDEFYNFLKKEYNNSKSFMQKIPYYKYINLPDFNKYNDDKIEWVLQEYIHNPLLIQKRKFHLRVNFIYFIKKNKNRILYLHKDFLPWTAKSEYKHGDFLNKDIHDSHLTDSIKGLTFENDFPKQNNKSRNKYIFNQIMKISKDILEYLNNQNNYKCYDKIENCYQFLGLDLMVNDKYEVKFIELNNQTSLNLSLITDLITNIVDPILPPKNTNVEDHDSFIQI